MTMEMNERHTFEDLPGIVAYFKEREVDPIALRKWGQSYWLIIEEDGKEICRQFVPESKVDDLDVHAAVAGIMESRKRDEKIRLGICPDCGKSLTDERIRSGCHKGHGRIYCSHCGGVNIRI